MTGGSRLTLTVGPEAFGSLQCLAIDMSISDFLVIWIVNFSMLTSRSV